MGLGATRSRTGHDARSWPVLLLLSVVVLVPTAGVLWFMTQAMRNERLAVQQKLRAVYEVQLLQMQEILQQHWQERSAALALSDAEAPASHHFAEGVRRGLADGLVIVGYGEATGYPASIASGSDRLEPSTRGWLRAQRLERQGRHATAAEEYGALARSLAGRAADDPRSRDQAARALQARTRCLVRAGEIAAAVEVLTAELQQDIFRGAADPEGRLVAPSASLRAIQLSRELGASGDRELDRKEMARNLVRRLNDYGAPILPAAQRRFLIRQLLRLELLEDPVEALFDTLAAEELTARYLASNPPEPATGSLQPTGLPGIWHLAVDEGAVVAVYEERGLVEELSLLLAEESLPAGVRVDLLPPGLEKEEPFVVVVPAGGLLQGWQLALYPEDQSLFATAATQQITAYRLIAAVVVLSVLLLALLVGRAVDRQLRLTRLKNDLLSTVSHELKTPLASMRLLVETLLEDRGTNPERDREYLQLIAQENVRLSRLVENFLTFSRMEQKRESFDLRLVDAEEVVESTVAAVGERFRAEGCHFEVDVEPSLPELHADSDALVTVLLNLLDNAYKYSGEEKEIELRVFRSGDSVGFEVRDNGVGLSRRAAGRIFDRFYQVDRSLSSASGCGLGLSIVRHIVDGHGGTIEVDSRPGEGSTFTVRLPVESSGDRREETA